MSEPGSTDGIEVEQESEAERDLRMLHERTPSREQLDDLIDHLGNVLVSQKTEKLGVLERLRSGGATHRIVDQEVISPSDLKELFMKVYSGELPADTIPETYGLRKLAGSRVVLDSLQPGQKPTPDTIPEPLMETELLHMVRSLKRPIQGSSSKPTSYMPEFFERQIPLVLAGKQRLETITSSCGLRAITTGVLQRPQPQRP